MLFIDDNNQIPKIISFAKKLQKENGLPKKLISTLNNLNEEA